MFVFQITKITNLFKTCDEKEAIFSHPLMEKIQSVIKSSLKSDDFKKGKINNSAAISLYLRKFCWHISGGKFKLLFIT